MPAEEGADGKGRHTTEELRELAKSVRSGTFRYDGRPKKSLDWSSYNEAQLNEMADTLNLIRRFVDRASARVPERPRRRGRPPFPARDVARPSCCRATSGSRTGWRRGWSGCSRRSSG